MTNFKKDISLVIAGAAVSLVTTMIVLSAESTRHEQTLDLGRATIAGQVVQAIVDSTRNPNDRAILLSLLSKARAVTPEMTARLGRKLLDQRVAEVPFAEAVREGIKANLAPFMAQIAVHHDSISYRNIDVKSTSKPCSSIITRYDEDFPGFNDHKLREIEQESGFYHWRRAFARLEDTLTKEIERQLDSVEFLARRIPVYQWRSTDQPGEVYHHLYILGSVMAPRTKFRARTLAESKVFALKLLGHIGVAQWHVDDIPGNEKQFEIYKSSLDYVNNRLSRTPISELDRELLLAELQMLYRLPRLFGRPLIGRIAMPLAELYISPASDDTIRNLAYLALRSMSDCGVVAQDHLIEKLHSLVPQIANVRLIGDNYKEVYFLAELVARIHTDKAQTAIDEFFGKLPDSHQFNFMESQLARLRSD